MTHRQALLLKAIIDEFIKSAEAVGSVNLANKYKLGVSPATIRNEMAELVEEGYLAKPHSSSGRVPTNLAFRFFIQQLQDDLEELETELEASMHEELFQNRFDLDKLIYTVVNSLAHESGNMALALVAKRIYFSGLTQLIEKPEFSRTEQLKKILNIIEDYTLLQNVFNRGKSLEKLHIILGDETGLGSLDNVAIIYSQIRLHGEQSGYIALIGPTRMDYSRNIPLVDFFSKSITNVISGW